MFCTVVTVYVTEDCGVVLCCVVLCCVMLCNGFNRNTLMISFYSDDLANVR